MTSADTQTIADLIFGGQSFWCKHAMHSHGSPTEIRSALPGWRSVHKRDEGRTGRWRRIEHREKRFMLFGVQKELALIQNGFFRLAARAVEHELGKALAAQRRRPGKHCLHTQRGTNLDDALVRYRNACVGSGWLCHGSMLQARQLIWRFAKPMSRQLAVLLAAALLATPALAQTASAPSKQGYWWYEAPKADKPVEPDPDALTKPLIPPMAELATWTPPKIRKLIEAQRDYAATVLTVDAVADFWRLQDFARRKARAFAGVTQLAMLQHPELNSKSANPMVGDARSERTAQKDAIRRQYLRRHASEFALVMFSRATCGYCRVQWPIVQRFQEEMGWQVTLMDVDRRPELKQRFGIEITPTTMIIRRDSSQRMVIASGVEDYPNLAQTAYQAVRLLTGDIRPEQFMTGPGEDDGFFDALGNGPVSATDPRALGGDLVDASAGGKP